MKSDRDLLLARARFGLLHLCGLVLAAGTAATFSAGLDGGFGLFVPAFWVALGHAILFGIPAYLVVRSRPFPRWWLAPLCGFAIGALPVGLLALGGSGADQASIGNVETVVDDERSLAGWIEYLRLIGGAGLLGAAGGLAFGLTVRSTLPRRSDDEDSADPPRRWTVWDAIPIALAVGTIILVFRVPAMLADRSCHNPMRDGRDSIGSEVEAELVIGPGEWPAFAALAADFARKSGLSYRGDVRPDDDFKWLQISLCDEAGTELTAQSMPGEQWLDLGVYQPQGGLSWRPIFRSFYQILAARWPGRVRFRDDKSNLVAPPAWLSPTADTPHRR